ncbi:hypothetical protein N0V93_002156 [Gnomoniopsis smithogilvyi]|uniref:Aminoglycoside phosphotransferase domain-containing protein n=1 Tax=Gnomoniopsis smithogilvyi TaxID=1191159 RepID=A0A9W9CYR2_9PEZI|nr:hypothetical protein N0V93_002156 [Gnomoniopsis smithogilvyi]
MNPILPSIARFRTSNQHPILSAFVAMSQSVAPDFKDKENYIERMSYVDAVIGHELHNYWGAKVIEHTTASGRKLALKVKTRTGMDRSEEYLMNYAASHGVLAPKAYGVYDVETEPRARVMVSDRVPGVPLVDLWQTATKAEQAGYKEQLRTQLAHMRECTQSFIGRLKKSGEARSTYNIYQRMPIIPKDFCGPFNNEKEFDDWCLARVLPQRGPISRYKWTRFIEREQRKSSGKFVLTHGDLSPRNIMAQDGRITGLIDWERGGFYPEYAEYAFSMKLNPGLEEWWVEVLKEILQPCSKDRLKFTKLVEHFDY